MRQLSTDALQLNAVQVFPFWNLLLLPDAWMLIDEARVALSAGDLPRTERAVYELRVRFGISFEDPALPQPRYQPYRPVQMEIL